MSLLWSMNPADGPPSCSHSLPRRTLVFMGSAYQERLIIHASQGGGGGGGVGGRRRLCSFLDHHHHHHHLELLFSKLKGEKLVGQLGRGRRAGAKRLLGDGETQSRIRSSAPRPGADPFQLIWRRKPSQKRSLFQFFSPGVRRTLKTARSSENQSGFEETPPSFRRFTGKSLLPLESRIASTAAETRKHKALK